MPGGGGSQTTSTQSSDPWSGAQPYLRDVLSGAQQAYQSGGGFDYPNFGTTVPFSNQTLGALSGIEGLAGQGNPLGDASKGAALGILNGGGLNSQMNEAAGGFSGIGGGAGSPSAISDYLTPYARGDYVNGGSPQFLQALDTQAGKLTDDVNRTWSNAGRYGSAAQTNDLTDQVGNLRTSAIASEIGREQGQQQQAAGLLSGEQQQGVGNRLSAYGDLANVGQSGAGNQAQFASLAPGIYDQGYAPYSKLAGVGSAYEDLATRQMQENVSRFDTSQQNPWARLGAYSGLVTGQGGMGGTKTTSVPKPSALQGLLSGGLSGAMAGSMIPGLGPLIGGIGGGLMGLLG